MSPDKSNKDDVLARKAKALFDESANGLDANTQSRLNRARQAALAAHDKSLVSIGRWSQGVPATGVAAAAVVAVVLLNGNPAVDIDTSIPVSDFELMMNEESFDMLQDLEFYSWIDIDAELQTDAIDDANVS